MEHMIKKSETVSATQENHTAKRNVGVLFAVIEILLGFRLIFKLLGANAANGFVKGIYAITHLFVALFDGIFVKASVTPHSVFEPATLISMSVIAILAWIVLKLMTTRPSSSTQRTEFIAETQVPVQTPTDSAGPETPIDQSDSAGQSFTK